MTNIACKYNIFNERKVHYLYLLFNKFVFCKSFKVYVYVV